MKSLHNSLQNFLLGNLPAASFLSERFNKISEPLNFILDSGSGAISLDSATTAEFNIPHIPSGKTINGIAGNYRS